MGFALPKKLRNDGTQLQVMISFRFSLFVALMNLQGLDISESHKVQSQRAVVEQTIADLKQWKVMEGNKIHEVDRREQELSCVISLHNLKKLLKMDANFQIPERRAVIQGEYIFRPKIPVQDLDLGIPAGLSEEQWRKYPHVQNFLKDLPAMVPGLRKALQTHGNESIFYPNVAKRGKFLHDGAYVLQLQVQKELLDVWTVKYVVGASYSYETHEGFFQLSKDGYLGSCCDCYAG
jgi:hypothetical protein